MFHRAHDRLAHGAPTPRRACSARIWKPAAGPAPFEHTPQRRTSTPAAPETGRRRHQRVRPRAPACPRVDTAGLHYRAAGATDTRSRQTVIGMLNVVCSETGLLDQLKPLMPGCSSQRRPSVSGCVVQLARLGGYLARASDPPPGNTVIWRGLTRLSDIEFAYLLGAQTCG
jgi:hypothetical protein